LVHTYLYYGRIIYSYQLFVFEYWLMPDSK
jgi:hypothetical protein